MTALATTEAYRRAVEFLYSLQWRGAKFGLENTFRLAALAGNPQNSLRFIHVAGTNGKGSTCAMLESIYRAAGLRVGLFTSPHLVSFAERIQVNRRLINEADVVRLTEETRELCESGFPKTPPGADIPSDNSKPRSGSPTFFEFVTVMALRYFAEQQCDLVIWETGLGGRLDSTNIVTPLASVITNVGIEHSEWLGDTIEKIATEKAGIIKPGVPVITAARPGEGLETIATTAQAKQSLLTVVNSGQTDSPPLNRIALPLHGPHQRLNAATALATVRVLSSQVPVDSAAIHNGLATVYWPGRMQRIQTAAGQTVLLDGAHNPAGTEALRLALQEEFPDVQPAMIFGVFRDKDSASMCAALAPLAGRLILTRVHSERSEDPAKLVPACREANPGAPIKICISLSEALNEAAGETFIVVAGSLYLVGETLELLHLASAPGADEKQLNEWGATECR